MLNQPMSSPMMKTMFGFLPGVAVRVPGGTAAVGAGADVVGGCMAAAPPAGDPLGDPLGADACVRTGPDGTDGSIWPGSLLQADTSPMPSTSAHVFWGATIELRRCSAHAVSRLTAWHQRPTWLGDMAVRRWTRALGLPGIAVASACSKKSPVRAWPNGIHELVRRSPSDCLAPRTADSPFVPTVENVTTPKAGRRKAWCGSRAASSRWVSRPRPTSHGGSGCGGPLRRRAARPPRLRRRLLDGPHRGDQRRVRALRPRDGILHGGRARADGRGVSDRATRNNLVAGSVVLIAPVRARCPSILSSAGGRTSLARAGDIPSAREARCAGASTTRWCTSRTRTRRRTRSGPTSDCPPRRNTSSQRAEVSRASSTRGPRPAPRRPLDGQHVPGALSEQRTPARTAGRGFHRSRCSPQRVRPARRRRQRLGVGQRLVPARLLPDAGCPRGVARNPRGPDDSFDPAEPGVAKRVQRGGSFLCTSQYCTRYLVGWRGKGDPSSGANHLGFRCVK